MASALTLSLHLCWSRFKLLQWDGPHAYNDEFQTKLMLMLRDGASNFLLVRHGVLRSEIGAADSSKTWSVKRILCSRAVNSAPP